MYEILSDIRKNGWMALLLMSVLLCACSDDGDYDSEAQGYELQVGGIKTNAAIDIANGTEMRVFLVSETDNIDGSVVKTAASTWRSTIRVKEGVQYYIYGYMPMENVVSASITPLSGGLDKGAVLTLNGIDAVTKSDICIIVGVQDLANRDDDYDVKKDTTQHYTFSTLTLFH